MNRLLVMDDDRETLETLFALLSNHGYLVRKAHTATEAFRLLISEEFLAILMDYKMPEFDPMEIVRIAKYRHIHVILVSGIDDFARRQNDLELEHGIRKPFDNQDLLRLVQRLEIPMLE